MPGPVVWTDIQYERNRAISKVRTATPRIAGRPTSCRGRGEASPYSLGRSCLSASPVAFHSRPGPPAAVAPATATGRL